MHEASPVDYRQRDVQQLVAACLQARRSLAHTQVNRSSHARTHARATFCNVFRRRPLITAVRSCRPLQSRHLTSILQKHLLSACQRRNNIFYTVIIAPRTTPWSYSIRSRIAAGAKSDRYELRGAARHERGVADTNGYPSDRRLESGRELRYDEQGKGGRVTEGVRGDSEVIISFISYSW